MSFKIFNRNISIKWLIIVNIILILVLFVFIDFYFYKATIVPSKPIFNSKAVIEQENYLKKIRSKKILNNCLAFGIDENRFDPHDLDDIDDTWIKIKSPYEPHFFMYSTTSTFPVTKNDNAIFKMMHNYIYKSPDNTTSSECELVLHIGGENSAAGLYAAAHNYNVILFEPFHKHNIMTRESIKLNSFHDICVTSLNLFVSNGNEENVIYKSFNKSSKHVNSITIDTFLSQNSYLSQCLIQNIKIDLQNFNPNAIYGARNSLMNSKVKSILFKYTPWIELNFLPFKSWEFLLIFINDLYKENKPLVFALDYKEDNFCYGPIKSKYFKDFHDMLLVKKQDVDLFILFDKELKENFLNKMKCSPLRLNHML